MARKPKAASQGELARSQLMAIAEQIAEAGIKKAAIIYLTDDGSVGLNSTTDISAIELVFVLRQAEHFIFEADAEEADDDEDEDY